MVQYRTVTRFVAERDIFDTDTGNGRRHRRQMRFRLRFLLLLHQFFQTVDAGRGMDELRHHIEQRQDRILYLADQLQERCHHAEGDGTGTQLQASPYESEQIAQGKARGHDHARNDRKAGTLLHVAHQVVLHGIEPVGHPLFAA